MMFLCVHVYPLRGYKHIYISDGVLCIVAVMLNRCVLSAPSGAPAAAGPPAAAQRPAHQTRPEDHEVPASAQGANTGCCSASDPGVAGMKL